jgi:hypothetical protein
VKAAPNGTIEVWVQRSGENLSAKLVQVGATTWAVSPTGGERFQLEGKRLTFSVNVAASGRPPTNPIPGNAYNGSPTVRADAEISLTPAMLVLPL